MKNLYLLSTDKPSILGRFIDTNNLFLRVSNDIPRGENVNIYITSDEEIKDVRPHKGKWHLEKENILNKFPDYLTDLSECKLVIMTTDDDLINDGVQAIDDEFLEWFVKNPSCEFVMTIPDVIGLRDVFQPTGKDLYKIIIPKEETKPKTMLESLQEYFKNTPKEKVLEDWNEFQHLDEEGITVKEFLENQKQETLEEAAEKYSENWEKITGLDYENTVPSEVNKLDFINGAKWQQEQNKNLYSEEDMYKLMYEYQEWLVLTLEPVKTFEEWFKQFKK